VQGADETLVATGGVVTAYKVDKVDNVVDTNGEWGRGGARRK
jgi:hypothetical protein